ncbi:MAG: hypothetical protein ABFD89_06650 [Bryobacteraceae bacterium]
MNVHTHAKSRRFAACIAVLALFGIGAAQFSARAATVVGSIRDVTSQPYGGQFNFIQFNPLSTPQAIGTNTYWPKVCTAHVAGGVFSASLVGGFYDTGLVPFAKTVRIFVDPAATNVQQFNDCALLATNTSFFFITNPLSLLASTGYVLAAVSPLASKTQLTTTSNTLYGLIQAAAGAAGVVSFNSRTGMVSLLGSDVTGALGLTPVDRTVTNGMASTGYVAGAVSAGVSGLASTAYVGTAIGTATSGLASTGYVASAIAGIPGFAVAAGTNVTVQTNGHTFTVNAAGGGGTVPDGLLTNGVAPFVVSVDSQINAYGYWTHSSGGSISIGYNTFSTSLGVAIGNSALGNDFGIGIGRSANGSTKGVSIGINAYSLSYGVAIGNNAWAPGEGNVAIGSGDAWGNYALIPDGLGWTDTVEIGRGTASLQGGFNFHGYGVINSNGTIPCVAFATTNAPVAGYYLRVDSTGTNLYYSPN